MAGRLLTCGAQLGVTGPEIGVDGGSSWPMGEFLADRGKKGASEAVAVEGRDANRRGDDPANETKDEDEGIGVEPVLVEFFARAHDGGDAIGRRCHMSRQTHTSPDET